MNVVARLDVRNIAWNVLRVIGGSLWFEQVLGGRLQHPQSCRQAVTGSDILGVCTTGNLHTGRGRNQQTIGQIIGLCYTHSRVLMVLIVRWSESGLTFLSSATTEITIYLPVSRTLFPFMVVGNRVLLVKALQGLDVGFSIGFETKGWVGLLLNLCKVIERRVMSLRWFTT
jgi:hypothetical protein